MTNATQGADARHAARSGVLQLLTMLGEGLLPMQRVLAARLFGQTAYGIYRASLDVCEVAVAAGLSGADKGLLRFVAGHRGAGETDAETRALGSGLRLAGGALGALALAVVCAAPFLAHVWGNREYLYVIAALAPTILVGGGVLLLMAATLAAKVTRINLLIRGVADPALLWLATVLAAVVHRTVGGLAVAYLASYVALFALAWAGAARVFGRGRLVQALRAAPLPGFARFALPLGVSGLMSSLLPRLNVFILGSVGGATQVAVFAAAEELGRSVVGVRYAFDNVVSPMLSEALRSGDRQRARYVLRLTTRWVTSAAAPIAVTLFVLRSDLLALYGPGFSSGILAMALLLLGHLINSVLGLTGHALLMIGRSDVFFWDNAAVTALHLLLSLALVPRMGVTGAAIASLSSALAMQLLLLAQVSRLVRISPFDRALVKPLLAAAVTLVVELLVARAPLPSLPRALAIAIAGACVYGATLMAVRPGDEERQFVLRMLGRLRGRAPVKPAPAEPEKLKSAQAGK